MIQLNDDRWEFYQDKMNQWQWRKFVANKVAAVSSDSFPTGRACVTDARKRGYDGPLVSPRNNRTVVKKDNRLQLMKGL